MPRMIEKDILEYKNEDMYYNFLCFILPGNFAMVYHIYYIVMT